MGDSKVERQAAVVQWLRDAIGSLIASVESGLGFDHAIYQYTQQADNELSRAFGDVLEEVQSGTKRREALGNMARRLNVPEVTTFVNAVIQADEQGISILETLKEQAEKIH
jgi:tight adherence protein C